LTKSHCNGVAVGQLLVTPQLDVVGAQMVLNAPGWGSDFLPHRV
jgi:hypothetical protein